MPTRALLLLIALGCGSGGSTPTDAAPYSSADAGAPPPDAAPDAAPEPECFEPLLDDADDAIDPDCPNTMPPAPDRLDEALALVGLDRCTLAFTEDEWDYFPNSIRADDFRLPFFDAVHDAPLRAPPWAGRVVQGLDDAAASDAPVARAIQLAADRLGHGAAEICAPPAAATTLADALVAIGADGDDLAKALADVPSDLASALVPIVEAIAFAAAARDAAIAAWSRDPEELYETVTTLVLRHGQDLAIDVADDAVRDFLAGGMDYAALYKAAAALALAVERADLGRFSGATGFDIDLETPLGRVLVRDAADHVHEPASYRDPVALLVDTGGDDLYRVPAGATARFDRPVSVAVDLGGADEYAYEEEPASSDDGRLVSDTWGRFSGYAASASMVERQGAARLGIGLLFDLGGGDDRYRSLRMSQGFAALGVGALYDDGGDDVYEAEAAAQGSALFGIGLLLDAGDGADEYRAYTMSQGFGYVRGLGALHEAGGDDAFLCDSGDPAIGGDTLYFSPQLPDRANSSFCQGAGFGRRDDAQGFYMSGGIGLLRDAAGDDRYEAGVFAQGAGYWFGAGVLDDASGDDTYDGFWYVQGSGAHMALDVFRDRAGADAYNHVFAPVATSIGVGHDFTVSFHLDEGGDDDYVAPGLALGAGNEQGFGFFFNVGGNDRYAVPADRSLGAANAGGYEPRFAIKTIGVFIDLGGADAYTIGGAEIARDDATWTQNAAADPETANEHGAGVDASAGELLLP
ncbi:MAG: hypothetical protein AABZ30_00070 [Myxococcota bacterium]